MQLTSTPIIQAWERAGLPLDWPADLPLPPESRILGHALESFSEALALRIGLESSMSPLGLAAYFDALAAGSGFAECSIEVSDEMLTCSARGATRSLQLKLAPAAEAMQGWLLLVNERNLLFNPRRTYMYCYGRRVCDAYPPGFPSSILCPLPGATLVFASQRGSSESSLGQHTRAITGVVHDFYQRHLSDSGFRSILSSEAAAGGGCSSVFGRQDEVVRVESYERMGLLRVECHYSTTGTSSNTYDRGWR